MTTQHQQQMQQPHVAGDYAQRLVRVTPREQAVFAAGIEAARQMAMVAAVTIEVRPDARETRQQAAAAALQGLAEGLRGLALPDRQADEPDEALAKRRQASR